MTDTESPLARLERREKENYRESVDRREKLYWEVHNENKAMRAERDRLIGEVLPPLVAAVARKKAESDPDLNEAAIVRISLNGWQIFRKRVGWMVARSRCYGDPRGPRTYEFWIAYVTTDGELIVNDWENLKKVDYRMLVWTVSQLEAFLAEDDL